MERQPDLAAFRLKLWDRFVTMNKLYKVNMSFDQIWYEFLTRQFLSDFPIEQVYEEVCNDLEKRVRLH